MSMEQYLKYSLTYGRELAIKRPDPKLKAKNPKNYEERLKEYIRAKKFEATRRISNFYYGQPYIDSEGELINYGLLPDKLSKYGGWVNDETLSRKKLLLKYSPKFTAIIANVLLNWGTKNVIFSWYKTKGGVDILNTLFEKCGIKSEVFSGELSDAQRISIIKKFNSPENRNGELIPVLLITDAGAEGINLIETNNIHITESSTNQMRINQVIGRVVRYKSHINLPPNRQYVNVWRYWSKPIDKFEMGIDNLLFENGRERIIEIEKFQQRLIDNSIENKIPEKSKMSHDKTLPPKAVGEKEYACVTPWSRKNPPDVKTKTNSCVKGGIPKIGYEKVTRTRQECVNECYFD
jgi:superfamily II DNA or RNA helicase